MVELVKCPVCGENVSSEAEICPHCGQRLQKIKATSSGLDQVYLVWAAISILIALAGFLSLLFSFLIDGIFALLYRFKQKDLDEDVRLDTNPLKKSRKYIIIAAIIRTIIACIFYFLTT